MNVYKVLLMPRGKEALVSQDVNRMEIYHNKLSLILVFVKV